MKFNKIASVFFSICAFLLFSCNNLTEKENLSDDVERQATLKINLSDSSRTVLPHLENFEDLGYFELSGIISENDYYKNLEYNSSYYYRDYREENTLGKYSSFSDLQNAKINLDVGEWTFTLTAKKGDSTYKATKTQSIVQGENTISFELELFDSGTSKGSFSLTLDFSEAENADKVTSAKAVLQNINGTSVDGFETRNISVSNGKVCYSGNTLPVGSYRALITLYSGDLELLTWREIVVIASDLVSEAERKLDSLNLYTVTYVMNDSENSMASFVDSALETYNRHSAILTLPQVTRDYYDFKGWHLKEDLSDGVITELPADVCGDVTIYAEWKPVVYRINYIFNGGDNDSITFVDYTTESETFSLPETKKEGYTFCGWYENENFSGDSITEISKGSGRDKTLYAKWELINISITYELNADEEYPATFVGNLLESYNYESTERTLPLLTRSCYDFVGWCLKEDLSDEPFLEIPNINRKEIKVYAKWNLHKFSLEYNMNGGNFHDIEPIVYFTMNTDTFALENPIRPGYEFCGWYEESDFSGTGISRIPKGTKNNKTLYAKWTALEISINYYLDGGEFITEKPISYKESLDCMYIVPYKKGQTFIGWFSSSDGTERISTLRDGKDSLYARWAEPNTGDIFLEDERLIQIVSYDESRMKAVAVLFYTVKDYSLGLGIYNSGDIKYKWCSEYAKCYNRNDGIDTKIRGMYVNGPVESVLGDFVDGSENWNRICEYDSNAALHAASDYPAFNYANTYTGNITSATYSTGWFLPSGAALLKIHSNITKINSIIERLNGNRILSEYYWSADSHQYVICEANSSKQQSNSAFAYNIVTGYGTGGWSGGGTAYVAKHQEFRVCVIRKFSWE